MVAAQARWGRAVGVAGVVLALTGATSACSSLPGADDDGMEGGFGLPTQSPQEPVAGEREEVTGSLHVESNGCFTWDDGTGTRRWVVWPDGGVHAGAEVRLPDGATVGDGDALVGTGAYVEAAALPGWSEPDSYMSAFGGFCDAAERGVVVLDDVHPA